MTIEWGQFGNRGQVGIDAWVTGESGTAITYSWRIYAYSDYTSYNYDVTMAWDGNVEGGSGSATKRYTTKTILLMAEGSVTHQKTETARSWYVQGVLTGTGLGPASHTRWSNIPALAPSVPPGVPTSPAFWVANGTQLKTGFNPPTNLGSGLTSYTYQISKNAAFTNLAVNATTLKGDNLFTYARSTEYWARYRANGPGGSSNWTGALYVYSPNVPSAPTAPSLSFIAPNQVKITWSAPNNNRMAITAYELQYADNASFTNASTGKQSSGVTSTFAASFYGKTLYYRVRAINGVGTGAWSPSKSITLPTAPLKPGAPTLEYTAPTTVKIAWSAPGNGGAAILGYTVQYADNASFANAKTASATGTSATVTDVTVGKTWYFRVLAKNSQGSSAYSSAANVLVVCGPRVRINGVWKNTIAYVRVSGVWKTALPYVRVSGAWKNGGG